MEKFKPRTKKQPEKIIQNALTDFLTLRGWFCKDTHGSLFSAGWPDMYVTHKQYGPRWIEVKTPHRSGGENIFTAAQLEVFPKFTAFGAGIWVLVAASEVEYKKLFKPQNWYWFLLKEGGVKL